MSYFITGQYNLINTSANLTILGRLGADVVAALGPIGELSVSRLTSYIPKFGNLTGNLINAMTTDPKTENTAEIPALSNGSRNYKDFKITFNGGIESKSSVKSFKWLSVCDTSEIENGSLKEQLEASRQNMQQLRKEQIEDVKQSVEDVKNSAKQTAEEIIKLQETGKINPEDMHILLLAISNLFKYLNSKYGNGTKLNEKVNIIIKTLYDSIVEERGIKIGEIRGIISTYIEFKLEDDEIINKLKSNLNIDDEKANKYLNNYYKENKK